MSSTNIRTSIAAFVCSEEETSKMGTKRHDANKRDGICMLEGIRLIVLTFYCLLSSERR